ncbi:MAG TPA: DegT/DnrJ/EryC1/StrS family aminotransferase [Thermoanaerobaculia bacterium]|jgi:dTDP-4-amino-4,6-dideoxygalactose transaminase|nr:DegT/DnrJ/EryC1/StrS family aminotransferase [Thermoanaerobaculia bacterium]
MRDAWREVPPTAGLPLQWGDFDPRRKRPPLEETLAAFLDVPSVQLECSGTAALVIALTTLKRHSIRRSVIIPAYTCPLVALALLHCGLKPLLCDLAPGTFEFHAPTLARLFGSDVLAVIATHLGGRFCDLVPVIGAARRCGAFVIEDAAQSMGASRRGVKAGTMGDIGVFSMAAGKGLTLYEGGALVANDPALRDALRKTSVELASHQGSWEWRRSLQLIGYGLFYRPAMLRLAYGTPLRRALRKGRMIEAIGDDFSSAIPLHRVGAFRRNIGARAAVRLPAFLDALAMQAAIRRRILQSIDGITVIVDADYTRGTWPFFMVIMPTSAARDCALDQLWTAGVGVTRLFMHALPDYPYLQAQLGAYDVPNARDFAERMLTISNSPWLPEKDFQRICSVLTEAASASLAKSC